jgi:hypothetical protein
MDRQGAEGGTRVGERFQLPASLLRKILEGKDVDYIDPMNHGDEAGEFSGTWLAAVSPVAVPRSEVIGPQEPTDLLVLVQYRLRDVLTPVDALIRRLGREGAVALVSFVMITSIHWYFVMRDSDFRREPTEASEIRKPHEETISIGDR